MDDLNYLLQKHPGLFHILKDQNSLIILRSLLYKSKNFETLKKETILEKIVLQKTLEKLKKYKLIDIIPIPNDVLYYITPLGKKFITAYLKERGEII